MNISRFLFFIILSCCLKATAINTEKGKITGIVLLVEDDNPLNAQIAAALQKEFGVGVDIQKSTKPIAPNPAGGQPNPAYQVDVKYDVKKVVPGKPGKPEVKTEKWIKKTVTKKVATEEIKQ